jgi:raffinose/stachyose/melibiose transport system permease protein
MRSVSSAAARRLSPGRTRKGSRLGRIGRHVVLVIVSVGWLVPMYLMVINAFKPQRDILAAPFSIPFGALTTRFIRLALDGSSFNILHAYGSTALFVVLDDIFVVLLCGPLAYVIARGMRRRYQVLLFYIVGGTFIPAQVILIPVVYVLRYAHVMDSLIGLVAFQTVLNLPVTIFLYVAYIRSIPVSIDEAAQIDGAGRMRIFWRLVFPLMRPIVATSVILVSMGVWNDFVDPEIILGPVSNLQTVTTGIYGAIGQYATSFTTIFPDLLLVLAPALAFFIIMQRHIVSGLTSGATKA